MSTLCMKASETRSPINAPSGLVAGLVRRILEVRREYRRRRTLKELLVLHDGILADLGVSREQIALASRPRLPADVLAWIGLAR